MRVLLDECVDRRLARQLSSHAVKTVPEMGWATIRNGDLLALAEKQSKGPGSNYQEFEPGPFYPVLSDRAAFDIGLGDDKRCR